MSRRSYPKNFSQNGRVELRESPVKVCRRRRYLCRRERCFPANHRRRPTRSESPFQDEDNKKRMDPNGHRMKILRPVKVRQPISPATTNQVAPRQPRALASRCTGSRYCAPNQVAPRVCSNQSRASSESAAMHPIVARARSAPTNCAPTRGAPPNQRPPRVLWVPFGGLFH